MTKKQVNGAWEDITTFRKNVNGAWEDCQVASKVVDGAWQPVWNNYTPIIKGGVWMLDNESYKGQVFSDESMNPNYSYFGYWDANNTLMSGNVATEKDKNGECIVMMYCYWRIPLDSIPTEVFIEGWIDGGLNSTNGKIWVNDLGNSQEYALGNAKRGAISYNTPQWLELSRGFNGIDISIALNKWYDSASTDFDYYGRDSHYIPAWKINNLWVKF